MSLWASPLVTHFEDPDATLSGALPGVGEKLGVYARGYVLLFGVLLGGGIAFVFFMLDPMRTERDELTKKQEGLETLSTELKDKLDYLKDAGKLHETLKMRIGEEKSLSTVLALYLNRTGVPMRVALKCPGDGDDAKPRALRLKETDAGFGLVRDPSQARSSGRSDDDVITIEGTSDHHVSLYSKPPMKEANRIFVLSVSREKESGAINALINLKNLDLFDDVCVEKQETSVEDDYIERVSTEAAYEGTDTDSKKCIPIAGPGGQETCDES